MLYFLKGEHLERLEQNKTMTPLSPNKAFSRCLLIIYGIIQIWKASRHWMVRVAQTHATR